MTAPQWLADIDIGEVLAAQLVRSQFPALNAERVERFGAGWDNEAFLVAGNIVFRFPRRRFAAELIEREIIVLPHVAAQLPLAVSNPRFVGVPTEAYPWVFAGYDKIDGTTACSFPFSDAMRVALAEPLASFLRALHAVDPQPFAQGGLPPDELGRLDHARRHKHTCERVAFLTEQGIAGIEPWAGRLAAHPPRACDDELRCIVHGDLYARHVVVDENGRAAGIIDWGDVHVGDPALDIAIAHLLLPATAHAAFRDAYGAIDDRTWSAARYRAIYHAILEADYGVRVGDDAMRDAGLTALRLLGE